MPLYLPIPLTVQPLTVESYADKHERRCHRVICSREVSRKSLCALRPSQDESLGLSPRTHKDLPPSDQVVHDSEAQNKQEDRACVVHGRLREG